MPQSSGWSRLLCWEVQPPHIHTWRGCWLSLGWQWGLKITRGVREVSGEEGWLELPLLLLRIQPTFCYHSKYQRWFVEKWSFTLAHGFRDVNSRDLLVTRVFAGGIKEKLSISFCLLMGAVFVCEGQLLDDPGVVESHQEFLTSKSQKNESLIFYFLL